MFLAAATFFLPIAGAVFGCFAVLFGLAALITGILARHQIKATGQSGGGFAIAGIVIGAILLVLVICGGLASLWLARVSIISTHYFGPTTK